MDLKVFRGQFRSCRHAALIGCCQRTSARKTPAISTRKFLCQKLVNSCATLGQLLASRILYTLLVGEEQHEIARARFCTQSCSKVGQLLVNSSPTPHPTGSCRGLPCSSPLATPEKKRRKKSTRKSTAKFKSEFGSFAAKIHTARIWP